MKVLYLYAEVMGYTMATIKVLAEIGIDVYLVYWDDKKLTPYRIPDYNGVTKYPRSEHSFDSLKMSVDGMKSKVDDLVNWKHRILGGAVVLGMVITVFAFFVGKFWDYVTIKAPSAQIQSNIPQAPNDNIQPSSIKSEKPK